MAGDKKKGSTLKNIPTGARITMLVFGVFSVIAATLTFNAFSSDGTDQNVNLPRAGQTQVDLGAKDAEGFKVGEKKILDENSPLAKEEKKAREQEIERAKTEAGGGYMVPLDQGDSAESTESDFIDGLLADVDKKAKTKLDSERNKKRVPTGLDDVVDVDAQEQERQRRLAEMQARLDQSAADRVYNDQGQQVITKTVKVRAYSSASFGASSGMESEGQRLEAIKRRVQLQAGNLTGVNTASYNGGSGGSGSSSSSGSSSGSGYVAANDPTNPAYYDPYTNNARHTPQADFQGLSDIRNGVRESLGAGQYGPESSGYGGTPQGAGFQFGSGNAPQSPMDQGYGSDGAIAQSSSQEKRPYKALGDVCYGKLKMNVNSDVPTPVRVQFLDRRCNALFKKVAVAQPARSGDYVTLQFKGIKLNGKTQSLNAIALDPQTESGLFQDDIDRHIFSRYVSLAAAAALPGWSAAVTGVDVEEGDDGETRERRPPVEALSDQLAVVAGSIGDAILPILEKNFEKPPTIRVFNNRDILIMFMGDFFIQP